MRITKLIASEIAEKMTSKKWSDYHKGVHNLNVEVTNYYLESVPQEVKDVFKTHPNWISQQTSFWSNELGCSVNFSTKEVKNISVPMDAFKGIRNVNIPSDLVKKHHSLSKQKEELKILVGDIENALYNFRTFANIEKNLPEAVPFLSQYSPTSTALTVNVSSIQERLK